MSDGSSSPQPSAKRPKRTTACLHCRRQKVKCDRSGDTACSRCRDDAVDCIVRPRGTGLSAEDLRWQQMVEARLSELSNDLSVVKASNASLQTQLNVYTSQPRDDQITHSHELHNMPLPAHLEHLREILRPALVDLQGQKPLSVSIDEATQLWDYFYDSLAIFHGFTASPNLTTPSPLLFSAVITTSAKRYPGRIASPKWEELFQRALVRLLYDIRPKTWDDVVGLGIARTWFWKADEITSGLIYGSFVETLTPSLADVRSRRVWDFLEMTSVSHGILHLSTPIVPDRPPHGVPDRTAPPFLIGALNELFDQLGVINRALRSSRSLVHYALHGPKSSDRRMSYAEVVVLKSCRTNLLGWSSRWREGVEREEGVWLPAGRGREYLSDLINLYEKVAMVIIDGYISQTFSDEAISFWHISARGLVTLAVEKWSINIQLWPKLFLHSALIAAIAVPGDDASSKLYKLFEPLGPILQTTGRQLLDHLVSQISGNITTEHAAFTTPGVVDPFDFTTYTGSDSLWNDIGGVFNLPGLDTSLEGNEGSSQWWTMGSNLRSE